MTLSPALRRRLVSMLRYALWGCAQGVITCLALAPMMGFRADSFAAYGQIIVIGMVASILIFGGLTAIWRRLVWLAFPIAGTITPIWLIPLPNLLQCGHLWNCDPSLSGGDPDVVAGMITIVWILFEVLLGLVAAVFYALIVTSREKSSSRGE